MRAAERVGKREEKALRFIARREERGDPSPGLREIGCAVGLEGSREAQELLSALAEGGYLVRDAGWQRMLQLTSRGWRLAGSEANQEVASASDGLLRSRNGARRHVLRAERESMIRAGMSGDELLVVEEGPEPECGELVAALVEGRVLVKRLRREGETLSLVPVDGIPADPGDGPVCEPPLPVSETEIEGRIVYVVRSVQA